MPAKSKAQLRLAYLSLKGKAKNGMPKDVAKEYIAETQSTKGLPERKKKRKDILKNA